MKTNKEKNATGLKMRLYEIISHNATAQEPFGGDWPWCLGIIHQPKHPRLLEAERNARAAIESEKK